MFRAVVFVTYTSTRSVYSICHHIKIDQRCVNQLSDALSRVPGLVRVVGH